jgi:hypothetical protein
MKGNEEASPVGGPEAKPRVTTLTVTWGAEKLSPIQYHTLDIGPVSATVEVPEGMSAESAHRAVLSELRLLVANQFETQLEDFMQRVRAAATAVRGAK